MNLLLIVSVVSMSQDSHFNVSLIVRDSQSSGAVSKVEVAIPVPNETYGFCGLLCECQSGGHPGLPVPNKPTISVDVKLRSTK